MFTKKLFGVAIAALLMVSGAANAQINLSAPTAGQQGRVVYATETLVRPGITLTSTQARASKNGASGTYYRVDESQADMAGTGPNDDLLKVNANLGITAGADGRLLIRYDLTNAVFAGTDSDPAARLSVDDLMVNTGGNFNTFAGASVREGGNADQDYVIFSVQAPSAGLPSDAVVQLNLDALAIRVGQPVTISMSVFDGSRAVIDTDGTPASRVSVAGIISSVPGLTARTEPRTVVADVGEDFAKFVRVGDASNEQARLGRVFFEVTQGVRTATGKIATLDGDLQPNVTLTTRTGDSVMATFEGDFSVGTWRLVSSASACSGDPIRPNADGNITVAVSRLIGHNTNADPNMNGSWLCVTVGRNNEMALPEGSYTVSFDLPGPAGTVASPPEFTGPIGSIIYNGTTIRVPYLTTHDGYNQRVILVNRSTQNVPYRTTFTTEEDVTYVAGSDARGDLPAMSTTVLRVQDMVTLTGGTRASATINITAQAGYIDASVTQVNLEDGSADTVTLTKTYNN